MTQKALNAELITSSYIEYKEGKDDEGFRKHMEEKAREYSEKIAENRAKDSVRDDKQQDVSSSKGCY